ncbi:MAG: hypothetical protein AAGA56_26075 [Myxococcota bacterium]
MRLEVTLDEREVTKMYWERARVFREQGDNDRALQSLKDVTMLEPDHVGALALSGDIAIKKQDFAEAGPIMARLASLDAAPKKQRLFAGIAAVDIFQKHLKEPQKALEVLLQLYRDGLSNAKVRERLARTAARVGNWPDAVKILERLMKERKTDEGRADAARLAMRIYRDKLSAPERSENALRALLKERPDDAEALRTLLQFEISTSLRNEAVAEALRLLVRQLADDPFDLDRVSLLAELAGATDNLDLQRAAAGVALALGGDRQTFEPVAARIDARSSLEPQIRLDAAALQHLADGEDAGPAAELMRIAAPALTEALGPSTKTEDVGRRQRTDSGPMRTEVARWMGALGIDDFDLYLGGRDAGAIKGIGDDKPALVVGDGVAAPLDKSHRSAVARQVFGLRRGSVSVLFRDDASIASAIVAVCRDAGVQLAEPPFAVYKEVERLVKKAMSRRIRKAVQPVAQQFAQSGQDPARWANAARRSADRMALVASGDAESVIDQAIGPLGSPSRQLMKEDLRARALLSFALSAEYLELRRKLRMGAV